MSSAIPPVRKMSRRKRFAFVTLALLLAAAVSELICWGALRYVEITYAVSTKKILEEVRRSGESGLSNVEAIHPYLGWVFNPETNKGTTLFDRTISVNQLGFNDEEHGIPKRGPDHVIVGITGGSVAWQVSVAGEKRLRAELEQTPYFRGKKIVLVRLAMAGYKQPQQLMSLNYMLALGAEFDLIVNIDGYNEVALTVAENGERGVFAAYPRMWHARMQDVVDPRKYSVSFRLFQARGLRQKLAEDRRQSPLAWSQTLNLIWYLRDKNLENHILQIGSELRDQKRDQGLGFTALGPVQIFEGKSGFHAHVVDLWINASQQMQKLCAANGIAYLHILQPNQYLPGSKPMGEQERKKALYEYQEYGQAVKEIYPLLIKQVASAKETGLNVHDLTMLFSEIQEPIYADPFCHYNEQGNDILAKALVGLITDTVDRFAKSDMHAK